MGAHVGGASVLETLIWRKVISQGAVVHFRIAFVALVFFFFFFGGGRTRSSRYLRQSSGQAQHMDRVLGLLGSATSQF